MNQFKRAQVVMLPTKIDSCNLVPIIKHINGKLQYLNMEFTNNSIIGQHLYIISDDLIKEGDKVFDNHRKVILECPDKDNEVFFKLSKHRYKKIIATTDTSLSTKLVHSNPTNIASVMISISLLPQPSQQFIEKYIEEYNKGNTIKDVLVEYEEGLNKPLHEALRDSSPLVFERLKINSKDNTITIKKLKESWNREEVIQLIKKHISDWQDKYYSDGVLDLNNWIKENL